jgi:hypothetical protein
VVVAVLEQTAAVLTLRLLQSKQFLSFANVQANQNKRSRTSHRGGIVKTNNNQRSVTVGARLDPALNENNDDIDPQSRGRGRGRNRGLGRGRAQATPRQSPLPLRPPRSQRALLMYADCFWYVSMLTSRSVQTCRADYPTPHRSYRL